MDYRTTPIKKVTYHHSMAPHMAARKEWNLRRHTYRRWYMCASYWRHPVPCLARGSSWGEPNPPIGLPVKLAASPQGSRQEAEYQAAGEVTAGGRGSSSWWRHGRRQRIKQLVKPRQDAENRAAGETITGARLRIKQLMTLQGTKKRAFFNRFKKNYISKEPAWKALSRGLIYFKFKQISIAPEPKHRKLFLTIKDETAYDCLA